MAVSPHRLPNSSANFYELLDLPPFESDTARIQERLRESMKDFRKYQVGAYAAQAEECLNRVALAKRCLLDSQQKARYDEQLRGEFDLPPLTVRASLPPESDDSDHARRSTSLSDLVGRTLTYPGRIWRSLRQFFVKPATLETESATGASASFDTVPAAAEPPPLVDAPWETLPVSETGSLTKIS